MCIRKKIGGLAGGAGRLFDFAGSYNIAVHYYLTHGSTEIDSEALYSDWKTVGADMESALEQYCLDSGVVYHKLKTSGKAKNAA